jgi:hypothetical protein
MSVLLLTHVARPGARLARPVLTPDGLPLLGRGTVLGARHLGLLNDMGVRTVEVEDDPRLGPWEVVPEPDAWLSALEARFSTVSTDRRMVAMKDAVREVYLEYLRAVEPAQ